MFGYKLYNDAPANDEETGVIMHESDIPPLMTGLLILCKDQQEHSNQEALMYLAKMFSLDDEFLNLRTESGKDLFFKTRVEVARNFAKKAGLTESSRRGYFRITQIGFDLVSGRPVDSKYAVVHSIRRYLRMFGELKPLPPWVMR
jgi:restriction endonuclease Mrr